jgi:UMF1 family MFS transporter
MTTATTGFETPAGERYSTRRERVGWYFYDFANSAFATTVISVFLGPYLTSIAENAAGCSSSGGDCTTPLFHVFGIQVLPGSVYPYAVSLSVILQVLVLPVTGAIADRSSRKKQLLALMAYIGSGATIGLVFLTGTRWQLGAALFIIANIALGASSVVYNSFLPQLAPPDKRDSVSSIGWAIGYIGGGLLLLLNLIPLILQGDHANKSEIARWSIVSAGVWWAVFTSLPLARLVNRPAVAGEEQGNVLLDGFRQLGGTLRHLFRYKLTFYFLIA